MAKKKLKCKGLFDFEVKLVRETKGKGERDRPIYSCRINWTFYEFYLFYDITCPKLRKTRQFIAIPYKVKTYIYRLVNNAEVPYCVSVDSTLREAIKPFY